jgi:dihydropteroate synthase
VSVSADLVFRADGREQLAEIVGWDGVRQASLPLADFPVDVVRFSGSTSPPLVVSRGRRPETLKALPATLRERAREAFERAERPAARLGLPGGRSLDLSAGPVLLGILNVTPDSFSDGGLYFDRERAVARALEMFAEGAAMVDVGGESTRPATYGETSEIGEEEEIDRVLPVIDGIRRSTGAPLSVDTRRSAVARAALAAGADAVNDISALRRDPRMAETVAAAGAGLILMHMRGDDPRRMQEDTRYAHPVADVAEILADAAARALDAGVAPDRIAIDPGLGFGKSAEGNLLLLRHLAAFRTLGLPVAAGASRKGFVRKFSGVPEDSSAADRLPGSLAAAAAAASAGAAILRVHDVGPTARFLKMARAISSPAPAAAAAAIR